MCFFTNVFLHNCVCKTSRTCCQLFAAKRLSESNNYQYIHCTVIIHSVWLQVKAHTEIEDQLRVSIDELYPGATVEYQHEQDIVKGWDLIQQKVPYARLYFVQDFTNFCFYSF